MSEGVRSSATSAAARRTPIKEVVGPPDRAEAAPLGPPYRMEDLHEKVIPVLPTLGDVVQKGLTGPEVKGGGEEEATDAL